MTTLARITIGLILALFATSCGMDINFGTGVKGNGKVVTNTREITDKFSEVSAAAGIEVYVTQASKFKIEVEADENIIDLIGTEIKNGKLRIHTKENIGQSTKKVYVSLPDITVLKSSSGAHLTTEETINSEKLEIDASSGSILKIEIVAKNVEIDASSGANIDISGKTQKVYLDGSSGANIRATGLDAKIGNAHASSGSNIAITISEDLTADASSGGNISYSGNPNVKKNKSVSGSVRKN